MSYQDKIQEYKNGQMTELELFVFEQELKENPKLQQAYNASALVDDVLSFTGTHLSDEQVMNTKSSIDNNLPSPSNKRYIVLAGLLIFGFAYFFYTIENKPSDLYSTEIIPTKQTIAPQVEKAVTTPAIKETPVVNPAPVIKVPVTEKPQVKTDPKPLKKPIKTKKYSEPYAATPNNNAPEVHPQNTNQDNLVGVVLEPGFSVAKNHSFEADVKDGNPLALRSSKKSIESDEIVNKGQSVTYTAGNSIILKPGFQVKSGAAFTASIETNIGGK